MLPKYLYFDRHGREVRKRHFVLTENGYAPIEGAHEYNNKGQLKKSAIPHYLHETPYYIVNNYDAVGRKTNTKMWVSTDVKIPGHP